MIGLVFSFSSYSDVGTRENNEDSLDIQIREGTLLAVVADGLGGCENGELASRVAVESIFRELEGQQCDEEVLAYSLIHASQAILDARINGQTTAVLLWLDNNQGAEAHVGDSRIYQFRNGRIIFQSEDHSLVQMAVNVGELSPDALRHHKDRNKLFRVLGEENETPKVDSAELEVRSGDRFLLCSDGFWEPVTEEEMLRTLAESDTAEQWLEAMKQIVADARDPRQDNNTAICIFAES